VAQTPFVQPGLVAVPALVSRERESAQLAAALAGGAALVLIEGEAGVGKTRLVQEVLTAAGPPVRAVTATCPPFRESLTLGPVVDALRPARALLGGDRLTALAGALRPLFPDWADRLPPAPEPLTDPRASRHRMFRALAELIDGLGLTALVVEDVHWADDATLEFLLFLSAGAGDVRLVLTYRPDDVPSGSLLLRLSSRPQVGGAAPVRLSLGLLDVDGTAALVSSMLGGEPVSAAFARFLHARTDGLPLAVEESVRLLRERDDVIRRDGEWVRRSLAELTVPPTVRDSVLERVQRLGDGAQRILAAAAVLAEPAHEAELAAVAGLSSADEPAALLAAAGSGLLTEDVRGRLAFRHVLAGDAIHEALPSTARRRLHARAGELLARRDPPPVMRLTRHFRAAGDVAHWCRYAELAAAQAVASDDHSTAVTLLAAVVTTADPRPPELPRLAAALATAAASRRETVDALHLRVIEALREVLDSGGLTPVQQAEIRSPLGRLLLQSDEFEAARAELERAVPHLGHRPAEAAAAMTLLGYPLPGPRPAAEYLRWLRRASRVAAAVPSPLDRLALTVDRAAALLVLGEPAGWDVVARLPVAPPTVAERCQLARGHANIGYAALLWGRQGDAARHLRVAAELADAARYSRLSASIRDLHALLDWFTGSWDGLADRVARTADPDDGGQLGGALVTALFALAGGTGPDAEAPLLRLLEVARPDGVATIPLTPAAALARRRLEGGDIDAALRLTEEPMRTVQVTGAWIWAADVAPVRVDALLAAGSARDAAELVAAFAAGLTGRDAPGPAAALAACRAALLAAGDGGAPAADPAAAAQGFAEAAARWGALPRPHEAALARERAARCLLAGGRRDDGVALLREAHAALTGLGACADAQRVDAAIREHTGARRGRRGYGDELSPRELDVVRLVTTGRTNREIAAAVSRSPKTVAAQLNSAMRKLGVSSRTALAVSAIEAGLVSADPPRPPSKPARPST
jgi:DNA-binding CsgD family transcriptional regulator